MHWATIRVQVRRTPSTSHAGEFRAKETHQTLCLNTLLFSIVMLQLELPIGGG